MAKAQWLSDPNCPPENRARAEKWFERLGAETEVQLVRTLKKAEKEKAADQVAEAIQARSEEIKNSSFRKLTELRQVNGTLRDVACKMGCNYCCHLQVSCAAPETIRVAEHLKKTRTPRQLSAIVLKMRAHRAYRASLTKKQRSCGNVAPCPFLGKKGECTIYEVRPLVCRTYHSFNVKQCERVFLNPEKRLDVDMFVEPCDTRDALAWALHDASEKVKIPSYDVELIGAVLIALDNPNAATLWRQGVDIFATAKDNI